jgi:catalase
VLLYQGRFSAKENTNVAKSKRETTEKAVQPKSSSDTPGLEQKAKSGLSRRSVLKGMSVSAGALSLAPRTLTGGAPAIRQTGADDASPAPGVDAQAAPQVVSVADGEFLTTNQGVRINDNQNTLRAGERGPSLLEDFIFREKITQFDHERIPERVVHARGSGAHGVFQVYEPQTQYTRAAFLQDPAVETPVFVRFSTVNGSRGSADTVRDARGFATKFYTAEGVFDLVGNNIPVFFIQDAIKFPDLVHSFKPEPDHEIPQASTAHDTFWDFISLTPESMHMIMWIMSDRAIPRSLRMMEGFGVHTFRLVNDQGQSTFVKFHWKPLLGVHSLVWDEAQKISGKDPDFHRRDLWEAIEMGGFPEYELGFQLVSEEEAGNFDFDLLDPTKIIPEDLVPVTPVGKMTLNRNPVNFFMETEQVAFHIGHIVPGIDFSNDPLLQGRLFSYLDTQLNRFGTPNFHQLPINQSKSPINNFNQDGFMRYANRPGKVNYEPNSLGGGGGPREAGAEEGGFVSYPEEMSGTKARVRSETFADHYSQATLFYNSMSAPEKEHITQALQFELGKVMVKDVQQRMVDHLANIDAHLATDVGNYLGVTPQGGSPNTSVGAAKALSQLETIKDTPKGRKVAILAADGVDAADVQAMQAALLDAGAAVEVVGTHLGVLTAADGTEIAAPKSVLTTPSVVYDAVYVPSGADSAAALQGNADAVHFVQEAFKHYKPMAASGEGADVFATAAINADDPGVILADAGGAIDAFLAAIGKHRFWDRERAKLMPA